MADVITSALADSITGSLYSNLKAGDATVPKPSDNFFSWCTEF